MVPRKISALIYEFFGRRKGVACLQIRPKQEFSCFMFQVDVRGQLLIMTNLKSPGLKRPTGKSRDVMAWLNDLA